MNLELNIDDLKIDIIRMLNNADKTPFYRKVGKRMLSAITYNFEMEGAYFNKDGETWANLAPFTIEERYKTGYTPITILTRTQRLRKSIVMTSIDNNGVEIGTNLYYARELYYGRFNMPDRPFFPENELPEDVLQDIAWLYEKFVNDIFDK